MSDEPNNQPAEPAPENPAPVADKPAATSAPDAGFAVSIVAPDGARRDWGGVGGYLVVAFDRKGQLVALDTSMVPEGVEMACTLVRDFLVGPFSQTVLTDFVRREQQKRPGIITARGVPSNAARKTNGRILPG